MPHTLTHTHTKGVVQRYHNLIFHMLVVTNFPTCTFIGFKSYTNPNRATRLTPSVYPL